MVYVTLSKSGTQHNAIQENNTAIMLSVVRLNVHYAECRGAHGVWLVARKHF